MKLDKKDFVILTLIANHSISLTVEEIYNEVSKRFDISINELLELLNNYKNQGLIKSKIRLGNLGYFMEEKESKIFNKELRRLKQSDFLEYLDILPLEISNKYRIHSLEGTIIWAVLGWLLFSLSIYLIKSKRIILALFTLFFCFLFIGFSIGYFSRIIAIKFYRVSNYLENKINKKAYNNINGILNFLRRHLIKITFILIAIPSFYFLIRFLFNEDNFKDSTFYLAWLIIGIIIFLFFIIFFKKEWKELIKEKIIKASK